MTKPDSAKNPMAYRWGTLTGQMPGQLRVAVRKGEKGLNNRPLDIVHNHGIRGPRVWYMGYSGKAEGYHLFQCFQKSDPPRKKVRLVKFKASAFTEESKAGQGGCSMRLCPGEAVKMSQTGKKAYCVKCVQRVTGNVPCAWTSIEGCRKPQHCPTCAGWEDND